MSDVTDKKMPLYQCKKKVRALKIAEVTPCDGYGGAEIVPENNDYSPFNVDAEYMIKHNPKVGGYYVLYKDGYKSFSPEEPFEDGYSLIE